MLSRKVSIVARMLLVVAVAGVTIGSSYASDEEAISIGQHSLLGSEEDMRNIVAAIRKVRDNILELKE